MIFTVTFSPTLDYTLRLKQLELGQVNRTEEETLYPGGKGINVSLVLHHLGMETTALGFSAGFTGQEILRRLAEAGCREEFIPIPGVSRINVKIKEQQETDINGQGPVIPPEALEQLVKKLETEMDEKDVLVLAGSIPDYLPRDVYQHLLKRLQPKKSRTVVDATGQLLTNVLPYRPFLIKPNHHELGDIFGVRLKDREDIARYAHKLQEQGARNVLVSMAGEGALLLDEIGNLHYSPAPQGKVINAVGAGDSMVAGFLYGYLTYGDYSEAFRWGLCAGSATAFHPGLATRRDIEELIHSFTV